MIDTSLDFNSDKDIVACHIICDGKILFLLRRDDKPQGNVYGVPAGKVVQKETLEKAIKREIKEETGLDVDISDLEFQKVFNVSYNDYNFKFHVYHLYLNNRPEIKINTQEHKSYLWCTPKEALELDLIEDEDNVIQELFNTD